jgi:hypothetical protein
MTIKTRCPGCKKDYTLSDALAGKRVRCKQCTETFLVRAPGPPPNVVDEMEEAPPPRARRRRDDGFREEEPVRRRGGGFREQEPARPRARRPVMDEEAEDEYPQDDDYAGEGERPRRRPRPVRRGMPPWVWIAGGSVLGLLLIAGVVIGLVFLIGGGSKLSESNVAKVKIGMTEQEVVKIMGKPTEENPSDLNTKQLVWSDGKSYLRIVVIDGKVFARQVNIEK